MSEITILERFPIILTKDRKWLSDTKSNLVEQKGLHDGSIVILPDDAILVSRPIEMAENKK